MTKERKIEIKDNNIRIFGKYGDVRVYIGNDMDKDYISISVCKNGIEHGCGNSIYIYENHTVIDGRLL